MRLLTDDDCTRIYNEANGITTKNPPLSTERIFKAIRQAYAQGAAAQLGEKPFGFVRSSQWHFGHVACDELDEGAIALYTRREAK